MSDEEFDEESLRAAALKTLAAKRPPVSEQKFTPLPRPDLYPNVTGMHQHPIPSRVPYQNYSPNNFNPNSFQRQFNLWNNSYNNNFNNSYNEYQVNHTVMNTVPPVNQFRHQHHPRQMQFNYPVRTVNFQPPHAFRNQQSHQFRPQHNHFNNQSNYVPRHHKPVTNITHNANKNVDPSNAQATGSVRIDSIDGLTESRRLPERFSRIERSDSESEEDDRLDEFVDDDEDGKSRGSESNEAHEVIEYSVEVPKRVDDVTEPDENDLILSENVDYDDLLSNSIDQSRVDGKPDQETRSISDDDDEYSELESTQELSTLQGTCPSDRGEDAHERSVSPVRPPSRRVVIVARDTSEKNAVQIKKVEKEPIKPVSPVPKVVETGGSRRIRLKVDASADAIERRRLKFGSVDDSNIKTQGGRFKEKSYEGRMVRIPSLEEDDKEVPPGPNRKKLRSLVVLKK